MSTRIYATCSADVATALLLGHAVFCGEWAYRQLGPSCTAELSRDGRIRSRHTFDDKSEMLDDIRDECSGDWSQVSWRVVGSPYV